MIGRAFFCLMNGRFLRAATSARRIVMRMVTPYDWQEGISHRASYVESRLESGTPVIMMSIADGIVALTVRRQARKVFEIYDRLMFGAIGQQSDIENLRTAAIDFAHQEGFQRSELDVTIQRVISALSQPMKRAFADFSLAPVVARSLFAEVGNTPVLDRYIVLDYDGDFSVRDDYAYVVGSEEAASEMRKALKEGYKADLTLDAARELLQTAWAKATDPSGAKGFAELVEQLSVEVALLDRHAHSDRAFRLLTD